MSSDTTILVVDDDRTIVEVLQGYLQQAGYRVQVAYNGDTAVHLLRNENPNLLILDLMLPDKDGWDITRWLRSDVRLAAMPIIMLTARVEDTDKIIGLELGADDYITKPFNGREVVARVRALLRRSRLETGTHTHLQIGRLHLDLDLHQLFVDNQPVPLTPTEFKLLQAMMEAPNHTFTREELLEKGMGYAYEGMGRALDTHIKNLRQKIEEDPKNPEYIQTVYSVGYRLVSL
ncbi:MAG: response regulator transcription factor [Anaerolineaceae bacterium]|nr:response regulator transcription factor [Anaerolineaceae bacterium]